MFSVRRTAALAAALALTAVGLAACGSSSTSSDAALAVNDSWTRATEGPMTGSFGTLVNSTDQEITITGGSSPVAGMVELHEVVMADGEMVVYQDLSEVFLESDGTISKAVMPDLLHLSGEGYRRWAEAIVPTLSEWGVLPVPAAN